MNPSDILPDNPSYDVNAHLAYVQELHKKYRFNTKEKCQDYWAKFFVKNSLPDHMSEFADIMYGVLQYCELFAPEVPTSQLREYLVSLQTIYTTPGLFEVAEEVMTKFALQLKKYLKAPNGSSTVPLVTLIPDAKQFIGQTYSDFCTAKVRDIEVFRYFATELRNNLLDDEKHYSTSMSSEQLATRLFAHTHLTELFLAPAPFVIPDKTWARHAIAIAPSGHGKTQLIGSFVAQHLQSKERPAIFVVDPHGDLFGNLSTRVPADRLVLIDPDTNPPPLNFLDFGTSTEAQSLATFSYLMDSLSGGLTDKQGAIVPYLLKLLRQLPNASLETLRLIVDEKVKSPTQSQFASVIAALPTVDQGFFHNQFYSGRMQETKDAIGWKLYAALGSDAFRTMFSAKTNSVDFDKFIADRKVVVIKGGFDALGEEGMRVFLQFLVAQYYSAGMRRLKIPEAQRHLSLFFADEASHVLMSPVISRILSDLRKVNCSFVAATQIWDQIGTEVKSAVLGTTAIKIAGPVSFSDANVLARDMGIGTNGDFIRSMKAVERSHAEWAFYVQGMTGQAVRVVVPYGTLEAMPQQPEDKFWTRYEQMHKAPAGVMERASAANEERVDPPASATPEKDDPYQATKLT